MENPTSHLLLARQYMIFCLFFLFLASTQRGITYNPYEIVKSAFDWSSFEKSLEQDLFYNVHRMDRPSFYVLLRQIGPNLAKKYKRSDKLRLSYASMVSITLSYLGGARICDLRVLYRPIKKKVIFSYIWNVIDAINETYNFSFPTDHASLAEIERGFRSKSRRRCLKGCLGAIDGIHFWMLNPGKQIPNPNRFFVQRKNKFSLLYIACCNSDQKFTFFDCSKCSKSHDSLAFYGTEVRHIFFIHSMSIFLITLYILKLHNLIYKSNKLPKWGYFLGDNAFPAAYHMLVPDSNTGNFDDYNFEQSSNRMHIKCAFSMLVKKWAILWRPISVKFERRVPLVNACFHLHNFCIDRKMCKDDMLISQDNFVKVQPSLGSMSAVWAKQPRFDRQGHPVDYLNWNRSSDKISESDHEDKFFLRDKFKQRIENRLLSRPLKRKRS